MARARKNGRRKASARQAWWRPSWQWPAVPALPWKRIAGVLVTLAALGAGLWGAALALDRPIREVVVQGPFERVSVLKVEAAIGDLREQGFLGVSLAGVRERIVEIDWVEDAVVRRRWPAAIEITVIEQLPQLWGPPGTEQAVAQRYLDARALLAGAGLGLRALEVDARGAWRMRLSNGFELRLGRQSFDRRLGRFARIAAPLLTPRAAEVAYVDLRYSRGFAVGWREDASGGDAMQGGRKNDG